jgi:hypothetical protein
MMSFVSSAPSAAWFYKVEWATHKAASCAHYLFNFLARRGTRSVGALSQFPKGKRQAPIWVSPKAPLKIPSTLAEQWREGLAQLHQAEPGACFDRAQGLVQFLSDLAMTEAGVVGQFDHLALFWRQ